jgi:dihydrofolate synthase/folylpolyglutamate synthase
VNYPDSVHFLYALGNEIKTAKLGLERINAVLAALGNPHLRKGIIHVAGTNGKGSTCAMLESALRAAGRRTGLFTSPHLFEPTERIRIDGRPISSEQFAALFDRVHSRVEDLLTREIIDLHTTYFETVTAMAFLAFADAGVDAIVLEVGLGGRLDATNVVTPDLSVITQIDFDHEAFLGKSIESIAREKAGILKPSVPAVFSKQRPEAEAVLRTRATEVGITAIMTADFPVTDLQLHARGAHFKARGIEIECPLPGEHQVENAVTAVAALTAFGIPEEAIRRGIAATEWPGRIERISESPEIILDGAHNPAGARALAAYITRFYAGRPISLVFGAMRDKAIGEITGILWPLADEVIVTAPHQARALSPEAVPEIAPHPQMRTAATVDEALALARNPVVFVTGSLFLVAEARRLYTERRPRSPQ